MKFVKGMVIGTVITAGALMMYADGGVNKRRILKRGRQLARKIGSF